MILEVEEMLMLMKVRMPTKSAADFVNHAVATLTTDPYPEFVKRNYYWTFEGDDIECYTIYDIEQGKAEEALDDIAKRVVSFTSSVEGIEFTLQPCYTIEKAFALLGQTIPAGQGSAQ
jgi:hypothetical protein